MGEETNKIDFKVVYGRSLAVVKSCLDNYFAKITVQEKQDFMLFFHLCLVYILILW